jgi:hypothetical protein
MHPAHSQLPGQGKRLLGSLVLTLGTGIILDTSYQLGGIGIILIGVLLVGLGWLEHWQRQKNGPARSR